MTLFNEPSRLGAILVTIVTGLFLFTSHAVAAIDPDAVYKSALKNVESAASAGDFVVLNVAAYEAAMSAVDNEMTIQEACHQIAFVTITAASASGQSIESSTQAAIHGVSNAAAALTEQAQAAAESSEMTVFELDAQACAIHGIRAAAESIGLDELAVEELIASLPFGPLAEPEAFEVAEPEAFEADQDNIFPEAASFEIQSDSVDPTPGAV